MHICMLCVHGQSGCCENTSYVAVVRKELLRLTLVLPPPPPPPPPLPPPPPFRPFRLPERRRHMDLTSVQCCSTYRYGSSAKCMASSISATKLTRFMGSSFNENHHLANRMVICNTTGVTVPWSRILQGSG